ncbi:MAG: hypothetical protein WAM14_10050 [Candidatus Nitrosopolaris sp.]
MNHDDPTDAKELLLYVQQYYKTMDTFDSLAIALIINSISKNEMKNWSD